MQIPSLPPCAGHPSASPAASTISNTMSAPDLQSQGNSTASACSDYNIAISRKRSIPTNSISSRRDSRDSRQIRSVSPSSSSQEPDQCRLHRPSREPRYSLSRSSSPVLSSRDRGHILASTRPSFEEAFQVIVLVC